MTVTNGNSLYLVCQPCEQANEADYGVKMCERTHVSWYEHSVPTKQFDAWLAKHRKCGGRDNPDHFVLAHLRPRNADHLLEPAVTEALRVNGSN